MLCSERFKDSSAFRVMTANPEVNCVSAFNRCQNVRQWKRLRECWVCCLERRTV